MGALSGDLYDMGYEPTGRESPFDEHGELWSNGHEVVCDETGYILDVERDNPFRQDGEDSDDRERYRYPNSSKIRMIGGFFGSYDWGRDDDDRFRY